MSNHPWQDNYPPNVSWSDPLPPPRALESYLDDAAERWPDRTAIDFYDRRITYRELHELAARAASGLRRLGVGPGVRVGLHLPNTPHFPICFFAVQMAGGCVVNCSPMAGLSELEGQVLDAQLSVLVTADWSGQLGSLGSLKAVDALRTIVICRLEDFLPPAQAETLAVRSGVVGRLPTNITRFTELIAQEPLQPSLRPSRGPLQDEVAVLQYTGGTTGEPKAAMLTHANFAAVMSMIDRWAGAQVVSAQMLRAMPLRMILRLILMMLRSRWRSRSGPAPTFTLLGVLPLCHIFGLTITMLRSITVGLQVVLHMRFDPERVLADFQRKQVNSFSGVPSMLTALINHPSYSRAKLDSVLGLGSAGAPLPPAVRAQIEGRTGRSLTEAYGLTEITGLGTIAMPTKVHRPGCVGVPAPCTLIEVVDLEDGITVVPHGQVGELCISGPQVMKGYWRRPEETERAFRGGRFHTGDVGFIDPAGFIVLTDRKKDIIFTGGRNVYPRNIERAIHDHPSVAEVAVVGMPDEELGEIAKAFITLKPGAAPVGYGELCRFLKGKVADYEVPLELETVTSLPKTALGKVAKKDLVAGARARVAERAVV
jgi:long-chain acyl-CoA synthetase